MTGRAVANATRTTAEKLSREFIADAAAAETKYKGKTLPPIAPPASVVGGAWDAPDVGRVRWSGGPYETVLRSFTPGRESRPGRWP